MDAGDDDVARRAWRAGAARAGIADPPLLVELALRRRRRRRSAASGGLPSLSGSSAASRDSTTPCPADAARTRRGSRPCPRVTTIPSANALAELGRKREAVLVVDGVLVFAEKHRGVLSALSLSTTEPHCRPLSPTCPPPRGISRPTAKHRPEAACGRAARRRVPSRSAPPRARRRPRVCRSTSASLVAGHISAMLWNGVSRMPRLSAQRCASRSSSGSPPAAASLPVRGRSGRKRYSTRQPIRVTCQGRPRRVDHGLDTRLEALAELDHARERLVRQHLAERRPHRGEREHVARRGCRRRRRRRRSPPASPPRSARPPRR